MASPGETVYDPLLDTPTPVMKRAAKKKKAVRLSLPDADTDLPQPVLPGEAGDDASDVVEVDMPNPPIPGVFGNREIQELIDSGVDIEDVDFIHECCQPLRMYIDSAPNKSVQNYQCYLLLKVAQSIIVDAELDPTLMNVVNGLTPATSSKGKKKPSSRKQKSVDPITGVVDIDDIDDGIESDNGHDSAEDDAAPNLTPVRRSKRLADSSPPTTTNVIASAPANTALKSLRFALSDKVAVADYHDLRRQFIEQIMGMEYEVNRNNNPFTARLSVANAHQLANFFFNDLGSEAGLKNVNAVWDNFLKKHAGGVTSAALQVTQHMAENVLPDGPMKQVGLALLRHGRLQQREGAWLNYVRFVTDNDVYSTFQNLKECLTSREPSREREVIRNFLRERGYGPSKGRGWATMLKNYLTQKVYTTAPEAWDHLIHQSATIHYLVQNFGSGVLLLLTKEHRNKLPHLTVSAIKVFLPIFRDLVPDFVQAMDLLTETLCQVFSTGEDSLLPRAKVSTSIQDRSFLGNLRECLEPLQDILEARKDNDHAMIDA